VIRWQRTLRTRCEQPAGKYRCRLPQQWARSDRTDTADRPPCAAPSGIARSSRPARLLDTTWSKQTDENELNYWTRFFLFFFLANSCQSVAVLMTCRQMSLSLAFLQAVWTPKFWGWTSSSTMTSYVFDVCLIFVWSCKWGINFILRPNYLADQLVYQFSGSVLHTGDDLFIRNSRIMFVHWTTI